MWRVTHLSHSQRRRQILVDTPRRELAEQHACQLFGAAVYLAAIRVLPPHRRRRGQ